MTRVRATVHRLACVALIGAAAIAYAGCATIRSAAVKSVAGSLSAGGGSVTAHNDPDLIGDALPFALMMHESLLASVPRHEPLLTATCSLYTQYAIGFLAADAEASLVDDYERSRRQSGRAFRLAERGRNYCWRGLEVKFRGISESLRRDLAGALSRAKPEHVELLYWSAASLGAAIAAGGVDQPALLIDWPIVRALAEKALALNETWSNGALAELMITLESQGEALGGSEARARQHFARAVEIQRGLSPGPYLALATGVVKSKQDRAEFAALLEQALAIDPEHDPDHRLTTLIAQRRARLLLNRIDDFFLAPPVPLTEEQ